MIHLIQQNSDVFANLRFIKMMESLIASSKIGRIAHVVMKLSA
jgi:hypothetical protein